MQTDITTLDDGKVKLSVTVDEATFDEAVDRTFRKLAGQVNIPGFRRGKVPRKVLEARIGKEYARAEALQDAIPEYYASAVKEHQVDVIAPPEFDITSGQEDGDVVFDATVETRPDVTVEGYTDLTLEIPSPEPGDDEIQERIDGYRNQSADLNDVDRTARDGDHVSIDIHGSVDGEPLPGLTADDYLFEVGLGLVVPELDDQLRGAKAGDILEFGAAHPVQDDTSIDFRILVKQVKEKVLPDVTDDWVDEHTEFGTEAEMMAETTKRIAAIKRFGANAALQEQLGEALAGLVDADTVPQAMIDGESQERLFNFLQELQHRGMNLEQWAEMPGNDVEELQSQVQETAGQAVRVDLALRAIARQEGLEVTDDDRDAEVARIAEQIGEKPVVVHERIESGDGFMSLRSDLLKRAAMEWLVERVSITDPDGNAIERSQLEEPEDEAVETDGGDADGADDSDGSEDTEA